MVHSVPGPIPIPALACSYTTGLDLPSGHSDGYGLQSSPAPSGICPAPNSGILVKYAGEPANKQEGRVVGFLIEIFWALLMVGVPIGIFTLALVWWALQGGHFKESSDVEALKREIKAMSQRRKKGSKKKTRAEKKRNPGNYILFKESGLNLVAAFTVSWLFLPILSWRYSKSFPRFRISAAFLTF